MTASPLELLFALIIGHALADFSLQADPMARFKRWTNPHTDQGLHFICKFCWVVLVPLTLT